MRKPHRKPPNIQFTKEGFEKVQKEYEELQKQREQAVKELATASAMGDRSENAAYKVARQKLGAIDRQIRHTSMLVRFGKIVEREFTGKVDIGCIVKVHDGKSERVYTIVGGYESDIMQGKLSCFSPIGKSLMGKRAGEQIKVHVPAGELTLDVIDVSAS